MSGENVQALLKPAGEGSPCGQSGPSAYTGSYRKRLVDPTKLAYSTFAPKEKAEDGTHSQFFHQRDAVIGKTVGESVDPAHYLKKGEGVWAVVPPQSREKLTLKPPVDHVNAAWTSTMSRASEAGALNALGGGAASGAPRPLNAAARSTVKADLAEAAAKSARRVPKPIVLATSRDDFARVPDYLAGIKQEMAMEKDYVQGVHGRRQQAQESLRAQYVFRLDEEERAEMVRLLRTKLDTKVTAYNRLPLSNSNPTVHKQRAALEKSIDEIETCLQKIDRRAVFVYRDDPINVEWTKAAALEEARKFAASTM